MFQKSQLLLWRWTLCCSFHGFTTDWRVLDSVRRQVCHFTSIWFIQRQIKTLNSKCFIFLGKYPTIIQRKSQAKVRRKNSLLTQRNLDQNQACICWRGMHLLRLVRGEGKRREQRGSVQTMTIQCASDQRSHEEVFANWLGIKHVSIATDGCQEVTDKM